MELIWEMYQQRGIANAKSEASKATGKVNQVELRIRELDNKLEKMALICQAMWEIIRDNSGISDDMILAKMEEIDLRDGVKDGKMTRHALPCPNCGRTVNKSTKKCVYCGQQVIEGEVFRKI